MFRAHKIRLNPTPEQEVYFHKACGTARFTYNWALTRWKQHKAEAPDVPFGPMALSKEFNAIKGEQFPWVYEVTKSVCDAAFINFGAALKNFSESKKGQRRGDKMGFPKFKSKRGSKKSFGLANDRFRVDGNSVKIARLGFVNMAEPLRFTGKIIGATVSSRAGHWYISIRVEMEKPEPTVFPKESVGIDLGIKTLATLSDGLEFENQKLLRSELTRLKCLNRSLSRRKQGSNRWWKAKNKLAKFHETIANRRADCSHKMTSAIARNYRVIGVEDLHVKGMVKNKKLALSLSDVGFGEILRQIQYKSEAAGGLVVKVGRFFASSKTCSNCGQVNQDLTLSDRKWTCSGCGVTHNRDWNASKNIEKESLRMIETSRLAVATSGVIARGQDVRPRLAGAVLGETSINECR